MDDDFTYDVFLSHSAKDKPIVRAVAERLRADGVRVWLDEWEIKPGDSIPAKIEDGLEQSRVLVIGAFAADDERSLGKDKLEFAEVRWMEISSVLQRENRNGTKPVKQIGFIGERLDMTSVRRWRDKALK